MMHASFADSVGKVVLLSSQEDMRGIDAKSYITGVVSKQPFRGGSNGDGIGIAVCRYHMLFFPIPNTP